MNASWQTFLESFGAAIQNGRVQHFGDASTELRYALDQTIVADLSDLSLIQFAGEDVQTYLQGQLSNDLRLLDGGNSQLTSYCSPKGRMIANFLLWQDASHSYLAQLPASLREPIQKRLSMFVMRSKVKVSDVSDAWVRLGVGGPGAQAVVTNVLGVAPTMVHGLAHHASGSILRLPGDLFELLIAPDQASTIWNKLTQQAKAVGTACWDGLMIRAGIPTILPGTQEAFVPQMVNYELIGGVNFKKGCYPGQEIVARTQYLGKLKRRMYVGNLKLDTAPAPGDELFSADIPDQAAGMIVNAAPAPSGGYDVLAVIQIASVAGNAIHWKSVDGPTLKLGVLPYAIPA
ncbi:MAG: folate-binding protein [Burkholderiales bacterium]|nr:folate-binding protein [Burkholderiales bacterium]